MHIDLVIVGAGPAGLAAARLAAEAGIKAVVLDEQAQPGGQIYRNVTKATPRQHQILGPEFGKGRALADGLSHPNLTHLPGAVVWSVSAPPTGDVAVTFSQQGVARTLSARRLLLATGATERPMPLPGWTLPGVMTAGAAQILIKQSGLVPQGAVLAGSGPLLYLVAAQMLRAGSPPLALVETQSAGDRLRALRHLPRAALGASYLLKGLGLLAELRRGGVARYRGATRLTIEGEEAAQALSFTHRGKAHRIDCTMVLLHHGVIPNTQASRLLGLDHIWHSAQHCFAPVIDAWGRSSRGAVFVAGDGGGIGGAQTAALSGQIAALEIAHDLGAVPTASRDLMARNLRARRSLDLAARPFLDAAFLPYPTALLPEDQTIICRCEEVSAGDIRRSAALGCRGPAQLKTFTRAGMGPCQGRNCAATLTHLLADHHQTVPETVGSLRIRPPLKPVTLGELASLAPLPAAPGAD
ncbi:MAG: NAD(P)/FAD-dependent oxidoreductase [Pseudorhodobacter sp.]|nr:NAD(P)/FAD-dependent oxidoreductase [Pseudorhodobacter sp.]